MKTYEQIIWYVYMILIVSLMGLLARPLHAQTDEAPDSQKVSVTKKMPVGTPTVTYALGKATLPVAKVTATSPQSKVSPTPTNIESEVLPIATLSPTSVPPTATLSPTSVSPTATYTATLAPPTEVPPTEVPPTKEPPTATSIPTTPPTIMPPTEVPPTKVPPTATSIPTMLPPTIVPPTEVPPTKVPPTATSIPTTLPPTIVPPTEVPPTATERATLTATATPTKISVSATATPTKISPRVTATPTKISPKVTATPTKESPTVTLTPILGSPTVTSTPAYGDTYEDDTPPNQPGYGGVQERTFAPSGDIDYVRYLLKAGLPTRLETFSLTGGADTKLFVYRDDDGILTDADPLIASDDDSGDGLASLLMLEATTDTWLTIVIKHRGTAWGADVGYQLKLVTDEKITPTATATATVTATATPASGDSYENDTPPNQPGYTGPQLRTFEPKADIDYLRYRLKGDLATQFYTHDLTGSADTFMAIYHDDDGHLRDDDTLLATDDDSGEGLASYIELQSSVDLWLTVVIQHKGTGWGEEVGYTLFVETAEEVTPTPTKTSTPGTGDEYEDDSPPNQPGYAGIQVHTFHPELDVDYVRYRIKADLRTWFETNSLTGAADTELLIYRDDDGILTSSDPLLTRDDDSGEGLSSVASLKVDADMWLTIMISNRGTAWGEAVSYTFKIVTAEEATPTPTSTEKPIEPTAESAVVEPTYTPYPTQSPLPTYTPYPTASPHSPPPVYPPVATSEPLPTYTPYPTIAPPPTYTPYPTIAPIMAPTYTPYPTIVPIMAPTYTPYPTFTPQPESVVYISIPPSSSEGGEESNTEGAGESNTGGAGENAEESNTEGAGASSTEEASENTPIDTQEGELRLEVFMDVNQDGIMNWGEEVEDIFVYLCTKDRRWEEEIYTLNGEASISGLPDDEEVLVLVPYLHQSGKLVVKDGLIDTSISLSMPVIPIYLP